MAALLLGICAKKGAREQAGARTSSRGAMGKSEVVVAPKGESMAGQDSTYWLCQWLHLLGSPILSGMGFHSLLLTLLNLLGGS